MTSPPIRTSTGIAYDEARAQVLIFGGAGYSGVLGDTWIWDGMNWVERMPSVSPSARSAFSMAYDRARSQVVLFGGYSAPNSPATDFNLNDTWVWDGTTWTQKHPTSNPSPRGDYGLAYDSVRQVVVLFGGHVVGSSNSAYSDTWTWDGNNWTQQSPSLRPPAREYFAMAFDDNRNQIMLFGGVNIFNPSSVYNPILFGDTWVWDGTTWTQKPTPLAPSPRYFHVISRDPSQQKIILFGGYSPPNSPGTGYTLQDTWGWDGSSWSQISTTGSQLGARDAGGVVYDSNHSQLVLFGGAAPPSGTPLNDTWVGSSSTMCNPPTVMSISQPGPTKQLAVASVTNQRLDGGFRKGDIEVQNNLRWWLGVTNMVFSSSPGSTGGIPSLTPSLAAGVEGVVAAENLVLPCVAGSTGKLPTLACTSPGGATWTASFCGPGEVDFDLQATLLSGIASLLDLFGDIATLNSRTIAATVQDLLLVPDLKEAAACLIGQTGSNNAFPCALSALRTLSRDKEELGQMAAIMEKDGISFSGGTEAIISGFIEGVLEEPIVLLQLVWDFEKLIADTPGNARIHVSIRGQ